MREPESDTVAPIPDKRIRMCAVCGKAFPLKGKKLTCSPKCRDKRHRSQIEKHHSIRDAKKIIRVSRVCAIEGCGVSFVPKHARHIYHGESCQAKGIALAVEAQRMRRQAERM